MQIYTIIANLQNLFSAKCNKIKKYLLLPRSVIDVTNLQAVRAYACRLLRLEANVGAVVERVVAYHERFCGFKVPNIERIGLKLERKCFL